jgi:hypothetical protein
VLFHLSKEIHGGEWTWVKVMLLIKFTSLAEVIVAMKELLELSSE